MDSRYIYNTAKWRDAQKITSLLLYIPRIPEHFSCMRALKNRAIENFFFFYFYMYIAQDSRGFPYMRACKNRSIGNFLHPYKSIFFAFRLVSKRLSNDFINYLHPLRAYIRKELILTISIRA